MDANVRISTIPHRLFFPVISPRKMALDHGGGEVTTIPCLALYYTARWKKLFSFFSPEIGRSFKRAYAYSWPFIHVPNTIFLAQNRVREVSPLIYRAKKREGREREREREGRWNTLAGNQNDF